MGKNTLGKAVRYTLEQWQYLERYLLDGRLEISNNRAERSIKPFVIDRKNFLFANTSRGAQASAAIFSIIETAKENGLSPYDYLVDIFSNAPQWADDLPAHISKLMPILLPLHADFLVKVPVVYTLTTHPTIKRFIVYLHTGNGTPH